MPDIAQVHPDYASMCRRWEMARDFWLGGKRVLEPERQISSHSFDATQVADSATVSTGEKDPSASMATSRWQWGASSPCYSYLWAHRTEDSSEYKQRCAAAYHDPVFAPLISDVVSSILRTPPQREGGGEQWQLFWQDVDGCGTDIGLFIAEVTSYAFVSGRHHVIVDRPKVESPARSVADQRLAGERAYCDHVTPLRLRNWRIDSRGRYVWVIIAEDPPDEREPGDEWVSGEQWLRVWTRDEWRLYRPEAKKGRGKSSAEWIEESSGTHTFKAVPLVDLFVARSSGRKAMACESPFASQLDLDRHLFNEDSEMWETDRTGAFATLAIPEDTEGRGGAPIDLGPSRAFGYPVGAGQPAFIAPPAELAAERWKRRCEKKREARASAAIGRGMAEQSKEQRSAEAIVEEMRGQLSQMASWAGAIQEFDGALHGLVAVANGQTADSAPKASYMRSFYRMAVLSAANTINQVLSSKVVGRRAAAIMVVPVVQAFLSDFGVPSERIKEAEESIMLEAEEPAAPIVAPPPIPTDRPAMDGER